MKPILPTDSAWIRGCGFLLAALTGHVSSALPSKYTATNAGTCSYPRRTLSSFAIGSSVFPVKPSREFPYRRCSTVDASRTPHIAMAGVVPNDLIFRQLFEQESSTFTYILSDKNDATKTAALIDTVDLMVDRDATLVKELGLDVMFLFSTHVHADHLTGNRIMKDKHFPRALSLLSKDAGGRADRYITHMERIPFGGFELEARSTPGHTNGCMSFVLFRKGDNSEKAIMAFTGDALLIRGCGRTDFQQGDARKLYQSVHSQIFTLPDETILYPGHDYKGRMLTYVGEEKRMNPRLAKSEDQFVDIMNNLNLPYPKKIDASLPYNLMCGYND